MVARIPDPPIKDRNRSSKIWENWDRAVKKNTEAVSNILGTSYRITVTDNGDGSVTLTVPDNARLANLLMSGLTASRLMASDGSKNLVSVANLASWIAGAGRISIANDGDGTVTVSVSDPTVISDRGDPAAYDWALADLTTDGAWHDLDCSAIVPVGAKFIHFLVFVQDDAAGSTFYLRKNGNTNTYNIGGAITQVANILNVNDPWIPCDSNRVVEYFATNTVWSNILILVLGWDLM